jgi:uncharacterized iron-regulated membrane protein
LHEALAMARPSAYTLRRVCSKAHLYVGLALGLVLIAISLTGSALVFRGEIDRWLRPDLLEVEDPGGERVGPGAAVQAAGNAWPGAEPRLVHLPQRPGAPYKVWLESGEHAFVDAYRGTLLGTRGPQEGMMNTLFALHAELLAGETGLWLVGATGLLTLLLAGTGLVLWWPAGLHQLRWRRLRVGLKVAWRRGPWRLNYDLHRAGGFYTALFLVLVAGTGSALAFYSETGALLNWATGSRPLPPPPTVEERSNAAVPASSLDDALRAARKELPAAQATFVYLPQAPEAPLSVRMRTPPEWHPNGRSFVYLHPQEGQRVLRTDDMRDAAGGAWLLPFAYPLHVGVWKIGAVGSFVVRVLYALLGLAPAVLSVTGMLIWFRRWRKKQRAVRARPAGERTVRPARLPDAS